MARIPSILADDNLRIASQSPSASAVPSGFDAVAGSLSQAANTASNIATQQQQLDKRREREEDAKWIGDNLYQEKNHLNQWQSETANNSSPDYAEKFKAYAEERIKTYQESAPNKRSRDTITQKLQDFVSGRYNESLGVTERTRLEGSKQSVINQISFALDTLRNAQSVPGVDPLRDAEESRLDIRSNIDKMFESMPDVARKLRAHADAEIALGIAPADEEFAKDIVNKSSDIDESDKSALLYKIDAMTRSTKNVLQDQTDRIRKDHLSAVEAGNAREKLPLNLYSVYPDPKHEKEKDDFRVDVLTTTHDKVVELAPLNEASTLTALSKMAKGIKTERESLIFETAQKQLANIAKLRDKDRVSWLREYNPEVKTIEQQLSGLNPSTPEYQSLLTQRNDSILKYQEFAPNDYTGADAEHFLELATNDRQLMTLEEAENNVKKTIKGGPSGFLSVMSEVLAQYPDPEHQMIAFNDMVGLPGNSGLPEEYQLLWQNKDQWFAESYSKAISDKKAIAGLTEEKKKEVTDTIESNATWKHFEQSMTAAGRNEEAASFKQGITAYANYVNVTDGDSLKSSVNKSVKHLLDSTLGFTRVNGRSLMVSREKSDGKSKRTDDEVKDIGRRLGVSLSNLDPRAVDQSKFLGLNALNPDEKNIGRLQALRDVITRTGFFVNEGDGQSVTLYIVGDDGTPFQLRDRQNKAFQVYFDDLPNFNDYDPSFLSEFTGTFRGEGPLKAQPQKTYPLQQGYNDSVSYFDRLLGWPEKQTYWPSGTVFKRKEVK